MSMVYGHSGLWDREQRRGPIAALLAVVDPCTPWHGSSPWITLAAGWFPITPPIV
ncbi:MAG: hypothetical protein H7831_07635 [Magnetococcus sp. WYHC-3]